MRYPAAPRLPIVEQLAGHTVEDPYRWLEDPADPETVAWSAAQDALTRPALDGFPDRELFAERLRALLRTGSDGPPAVRGELEFRQRRDPDQQHSVVVVGPLDDPQTFRNIKRRSEEHTSEL